tara:strand:+ start:315 stop:953 length:639 start_codon:yes stop_codon:yes gene_type:complete
MNESYKKYFVIGFNKTATSTFHNLFLKNNLTSQHTTKWNTDEYTCFSDNGHLNNYKELDLKYENSIFILNVRELDKWLISRFKHGLRASSYSKKKSNWAYPYTREKCIEWINDREKYHMEILDYFTENPEKIIIVNTDREGWINYICSQLHFNNNNIKSQNVNKTNYNNKDHKNICELVNKTLEELNYYKKTILFSNKELLDKYITIYNNYI